MFTRTTDRDQAGTAPIVQNSKTPPNIPLPNQQSGSLSPADTNVSVIGSDLAIVGAGLKIVSKGTLQIDGEVQGDVIGSKVIIGQNGRVTGLVNAEAVLVEGRVYGTIKAMDVTLKSTSLVEGDVFHRLFTLEQGASFEGRSRRPEDAGELKPNLDADAHAPGPEHQSTPGHQPQHASTGSTG